MDRGETDLFTWDEESKRNVFAIAVDNAESAFNATLDLEKFIRVLDVGAVQKLHGEDGEVGSRVKLSNGLESSRSFAYFTSKYTMTPTEMVPFSVDEEGDLSIATLEFELKIGRSADKGISSILSQVWLEGPRLYRETTTTRKVSVEISKRKDTTGIVRLYIDGPNLTSVRTTCAEESVWPLLLRCIMNGMCLPCYFCDVREELKRTKKFLLARMKKYYANPETFDNCQRVWYSDMSNLYYDRRHYPQSD